MNKVLLQKEENMNKQRKNVSDSARRNYKDTLFRMLFNDGERLLELYNAVSGTAYDKPEELEIVTLENAIYMNMKNDLAFVMDFYLNLYEHQSTFNPNMPLRNLLYVAKEYQKLVKQNTLYASSLIQIPAPKFVVFYNGVEVQAEKRILKLSDAYLQGSEEPELELKVTMININSGYNKELLEKCKLLKEYVLYVERVRQYTASMGLQEAVERAVTECISEDILSEFLLTYRAEAISMSIFEYNEEREKELMRKAYLKEGEQKGIQTGIQTGLEIGKALALVQNVDTLAHSQNMEKAKACALLGISMEEYERAKELAAEHQKREKDTFKEG